MYLFDITISAELKQPSTQYQWTSELIKDLHLFITDRFKSLDLIFKTLHNNLIKLFLCNFVISYLIVLDWNTCNCIQWFSWKSRQKSGGGRVTALREEHTGLKLDMYPLYGLKKINKKKRERDTVGVWSFSFKAVFCVIYDKRKKI